VAGQLGKPILLEGEAGVGKTEVAKVVARILGSDLIRLQCYEGLDAQSTIYEWNHAKQILAIRMAESGPDRRSMETAIFSDEFLLPRPLLRAIRYQGAGHAVLLIDEIDRADEEFEAFLLEVLSDFQVTVPELGTFEAKNRPFVVLTSNRTRELNDALKRRCLYLWIEYPTLNKEREIVMRKVPGIESKLAEQNCGIVHALREIEFYKRPGVAETLDWARALEVLKVDRIDPALPGGNRGLCAQIQGRH
jgi:MoxR-like ATPase